MDLDDEELRATRILNGVEPEIGNSNKTSKMIKKREEKVFKSNYLVKKTKEEKND